MRRMLMLLCSLVLAYVLEASHARPTVADSPPPASPIADQPAHHPDPESCPGGGGAKVGGREGGPTICCVYGRLLNYAGDPTEVLVTLTLNGKTVTVTPAQPTEAAAPVFTARLDQPPLLARLHDVVTVRVVHAGQVVGERAFNVRPGSQQVDIVVTP